jgi:hypothetical protein
MGVTLTAASQLKFFNEILGADFTASQVKPLVDAGVTLNVEFTSITAIVKGVKQTLQLPLSATMLMKKKGDPALTMKAQAQIAEWIHTLTKMNQSATAHGATIWGGGGSGGIGTWGPVDSVGFASGGAGGGSGVAYGPVGAGPTIVANPPFPSGGLGPITSAHVVQPDPLDELAAATGLPEKVVTELKAQLQSIAPAKFTVPPITEPFIPAPEHKPPPVVEEFHTVPNPAAKKVPKKSASKPFTGTVIPLKDATMVGQRVRGTDAGSVYTVVAVGEHTRLAARVIHTKISLRAEFVGDAEEDMSKLANLGLQVGNASGKAYMSAHMQADDCPAGRVIGAFLFDCGIEFTQQMQNFKGLQHGDHK